jgi:hypothetical protein
MAIVVEEEQKSRQGLVGLIVWGLVFVIVGVAVYYVFFKRPDLVEQATPSLTNTEALSKIELKPDEVINSESFRALRSYVQPLTAQGGGRTNPFLGNF